MPIQNPNSKITDPAAPSFRIPHFEFPIPQNPPRLRDSAGNPSAIRPQSSALGRFAASPISHLLSPARSASSAISPQSSALGGPAASAISHPPFAIRRFAAFTLIELLVVIAVIGILAGLVLAAMGGIQKRGARDKAQSDIQALSAAIEEYHRDRGVFPPTASNALYAELTTDTTAGHSPANTTKVYFEPTPTIVNTNTSGQKFFQDPWGSAYRYTTNAAGFFEIWSEAGGSPTNQWIYN